MMANPLSVPFPVFDEEARGRSRTRYIRPSRHCPICEKLQTNLKKHLLGAHKDHQRIKELVRESPSKQKLCYTKLLNESISMGEVMNPKPNRSYCYSCNRAYNNKYYYRHHCLGSVKPRGVSAKILLNTSNDDVFRQDVLSQFRDDGPSKSCFSDLTWQMLGQLEYTKLSTGRDNDRQCRVRTMKFMNSLATLYQHFSAAAATQNIVVEFKDLFRRKYSPFLNIAVTDKSINSNVRLATIYSLKNAVEKMKGVYLMSEDDFSAREVNELQDVLRVILPPIMKPIVDNNKKKRQEFLRLPKRLPSESTMNSLKVFIETNLEKAVDEGINCLSDFVNLRRLTLTRLVSYNGRRVNEPGHLTISSLKDAFDQKWIDPRAVKRTCSEEDKKVLSKFLIAFVEAKNASTKVDLIIPISLVPALRALVDEQNRKKAGVLNHNKFVFAQVKNAEGPSSGFHDVSYIIDKVLEEKGLTERVTATNIRHLISTLFEEKKEGVHVQQLFYRHLGHDKKINEEVQMFFGFVKLYSC